ncbi:MAG: YCF48-related protein, partial [Candidatus Thiodiazotropha sp.]
MSVINDMKNLVLSVLLLWTPLALGQAVDKIPAAMDRPALTSAKAEQATLLAVTRAGPRLVAAGERGIILTSDDNGASWQQAKVPTSVNLIALRFVDAKRGWAVGHMGIVLHSEDGGLTWRKQLDGVEAARLAV